MFADNVMHQGDTVSMRIRYRVQEHEWTQSFSCTALEEQDLDALLRDEGFAQVRWRVRQRL